MAVTKKPTGKRPRPRDDWSPAARAAVRARQAARAYLRGYNVPLQIERMRRSEKAVVERFFSTSVLNEIFGSGANP